MKSTAFILMVITIISKFIGLVREMVLSYYYGTGDIASAFVTAQTLPVVIFSFIAVGVTTGYIPSYNRVLKSSGKQAAHKFTSNLNNVILLITLVLVIMVEIFAYPLVKLFAFGYEGYRLDLTIFYTRINALSLFAAASACIFRGYLNARGNFIVPTTQGFIMNAFIIGSLVLSHYTNPWVLGIGLCFSLVIQYILFIPAVKASGFQYSRGIDKDDKHLREMLRLAAPVILGVAVNQINILIDKTYSSWIAANGVTVLNYSSRLNDFVNGIVIISIGTVVYPTLSKVAADMDMEKLKSTMLSSLSTINILVLPAMTGLMIFSKPIIQLVFQKGAFTAADTEITAACLFIYAIGLFGMAIRDIVSKAFYALKDTKTPTINSFWMVSINAGSSILFAQFIGLRGLPLGTSLAAIVGAGMLSIRLRNKIGKFEGFKKFIVEFTKMAVASGIMGLASYFTYLQLASRTSNTVSLLVAIIVAAIVYGGSIILLKVEEVYTLIDAIKNRVGKKKNN